MIHKSQKIVCDSLKLEKEKKEKKNLEAYWNFDDDITRYY